MVRILLIGDCHGRLFELYEHLTRIKSLFRPDLCIQLGDFGFYPEIIDKFIGTGHKFPITVWAIDGNHEDHAWLRSSQNNQQVKQNWINKLNLEYIPRGEIRSFGGSTIGFIGGALNVDRPQFNSSGVTNYISSSELIKIQQDFSKAKFDLLVSHTAPAGIGVGIPANPDFEGLINIHVRAAGFESGPQNDCGDISLARIWNSLSYKPEAWAFGHFHLTRRSCVEKTTFVALPEFDREALVFWDTEDKKLLFL